MKRIILNLLIILSLVPSFVNALENNINLDGTENYHIVDRSTVDNYGVKKNYSFTKYIVSDYPLVSNPNNHVYDFANVLSTNEENDFKEVLKKSVDRIGYELVVVIIDEDDYDKKDLLDFGKNFYKYNDFGIGIDEYYSGVILVINVSNENKNLNFIALGKSQYYYNNVIISGITTRLGKYLEKNEYSSVITNFNSEINYYYSSGSWDVDNKYVIDDKGNVVLPTTEKRTTTKNTTVIVSKDILPEEDNSDEVMWDTYKKLGRYFFYVFFGLTGTALLPLFLNRKSDVYTGE